MYIQNDTGNGSGDLFNDIFRSNVIQFVNDKQTHPIVKYKVFIVGVLLVLCGLIILLLS